MANGALVGIRRDHGRLTERLERLSQREQPAGFHAIVVRDEDAWPAGPVAKRLRGTAQGARPAPSGAPREGLAALQVHIATLSPRPLPGHLRFALAPIVAHRALIWRSPVAHLALAGSSPARLGARRSAGGAAPSSRSESTPPA